MAATGLGPRAMVVMSLSASRKRRRSTCFSTVVSKWRKPTPVKKIIVSIPPVINCWANSTAFALSSSGTSRIDGLTRGAPPCFSIMRMISSARRLSNAATRKPSKLAVAVMRSMLLKHRSARKWPHAPAQAPASRGVYPRACQVTRIKTKGKSEENCRTTVSISIVACQISLVILHVSVLILALFTFAFYLALCRDKPRGSLCACGVGC